MIKKEEKRKVGRPKLADTKLKKQSLIMLAVCISLALTLLFTGAYKLNIIKFGKMKGAITYGTYNIGDEICLQQSSDCFYVVKDKGDTVLLLTKYGLFSGSSVYQSSSSLTNTGFSYSRYWDTPDKYIYDNNSILYQYIERYKSDIIRTGSYAWGTDFNIIDARLMSYEEAKDLINYDFMTSKSYCWWLGTSSSGTGVYCVGNYYSSGGKNIITMDSLRGVGYIRPIIEMPKSQLILVKSSKYTVDAEEGTIDLKGELLNVVGGSNDNILNNITISSSALIKKIEGNKLLIRNSSDTNTLLSYDLINYSLYSIGNGSSNQLYSFDKEHKVMDAKNKIIKLNEISINSINNYSFEIKNNEIIIKDGNGKEVDKWSIINSRQSDPDAYKKLGFDEKFYNTCVIPSYSGEEVDDVYLLTAEELEDVEGLQCPNKQLTSVKGIEKLTNLEFAVFSNNNLGELDVSNNTKLSGLAANNNNLTSIDLSNNINLNGGLILSHNKLSKIVLPKDVLEMDMLILHDNKLDKIDYPKIHGNITTLHDNPLSNDVYITKGETINYLSKIGVDDLTPYIDPNNPDEEPVDYNIDNENVISYKLGKITAKGIGNSKIKILSGMSMYPEIMDLQIDSELNIISEEEMETEYQKLVDKYGEEELNRAFNEGTPLLSPTIKVYDISSDIYKVDKDNKTIDVSGMDVDASKITVTSDGLVGVVDGDKFVIKDGDKVAVEYKILNPKKTTNEDSNNKNIKTRIKKTIARKNNEIEDIEIEGSFVSSVALRTIKGTNRNIIVHNDNLTFTINGMDIEKLNGNLDLEYEIKENNVENNKTLSIIFKKEQELPGKIRVDVNVPKEMQNIIKDKANVYLYKDEVYNLIAEDMLVRDNTVTFYVEKLGHYVLTSDKIESGVYNDIPLIKENAKLNNKIKYKPLLLVGITIVELVIACILGVLLIKKNKEEKKKSNKKQTNNKSNKKVTKKNKQ